MPPLNTVYSTRFFAGQLGPGPNPLFIVPAGVVFVVVTVVVSMSGGPYLSWEIRETPGDFLVVGGRLVAPGDNVGPNVTQDVPFERIVCPPAVEWIASAAGPSGVISMVVSGYTLTLP